MLTVTLRRMPYAKEIKISNIDQKLRKKVADANHDVSLEIFNKFFGINLKYNTTKIEKIVDNGLFYKSGLTFHPCRIEYMQNFENNYKSKWVITEINGEFVDYLCSTKTVC